MIDLIVALFALVASAFVLLFALILRLGLWVLLLGVCLYFISLIF